MSGSWTDPVSLEERERLRSHPGGRPLMLQLWRHLLFAHFPLDPEELGHLVPPGLTLDLYPDDTGEPKAWLGLIPFLTEEIRPLGLPPIPGLATFAEINVRTYVHRDGRDPSVLFLSLDGGQFPIRALARAYYKVPYFKSETSLYRERDHYRFTSDRHRDDALGKANLEYAPTEELPPLRPGGLEYFLIERYQILAPSNGRIYRSRIYHAPYRAWRAEVQACETSLPETHQVRTRPFTHFLYSDRVATRFFTPERVR